MTLYRVNAKFEGARKHSCECDFCNAKEETFEIAMAAEIELSGGTDAERRDEITQYCLVNYDIEALLWIVDPVITVIPEAILMERQGVTPLFDLESVGEPSQ